jgi:TatD DNase family protein
MVPGVDVSSSQAAIRLAETTPELYAAVGVHPNDLSPWKTSTMDDLRRLAVHPKVKAIGEIGLDYFRDRAPREMQRKRFQEQLKLATETILPVIVHSRNASPQDRQSTADVLELLEKWKVEIESKSPALAAYPGVLHSFSDGVKAARRAIELGFLIGITGPITFRNATELQEVVAALPLESMLIETDTPFLTPHPYRGMLNEPANVRFVAEKIAQIQNLSIDEVAQITTANAKRLFNW